MRQILLVRFGEIYLKGLNRPYFLRMLVERVKNAVRGLGGHVWLSDSRVFVSGPDIAACADKVRKVFGVHSVCMALEMGKEDFDGLCAAAAELMKDARGTFKVSARRSDKRYFLDSPEINGRMGEYLLQRLPNLTVDVHHPEHVLHVEIRDMAYLYATILPGAGGMPVGTNGRATLLLSGGIDSPVAGYMIAKRGVQISAVHFHSFPYTSDRAKEKVISLSRILSESLCGVRLHIVPFTRIQMEIHEKCPEEYTTLIMRRYMMRIAERVARMEGAQGLVTGESIGQVASQTMQALYCTDAVVNMPVFRPLIGFDKQEIIDVALRIGTFETSSLPYEDCCTVFTPRHPATRPRMEKILEGEALLDSEELIREAVEHIEVVEV